MGPYRFKIKIFDFNLIWFNLKNGVNLRHDLCLFSHENGVKFLKISLFCEKGGKFKFWFFLVFTQKGGNISENILGKGILFNSQTDDGVPIFHRSAGTGSQPCNWVRHDHLGDGAWRTYLESTEHDDEDKASGRSTDYYTTTSVLRPKMLVVPISRTNYW